jgi:hypothetical protein
MWRKALVVLALFGSVGATELRPLWSGGPGSHCTDRICSCPRHSVPTRPAKPHCHDDQGRASTEIGAACQHGDPTAPAPTRPQVMPAVHSLTPPGWSPCAAAPLTGLREPGHLRLDLPPPRSAA